MDSRISALNHLIRITMQLGFVTAIFGELSFEEVLKTAANGLSVRRGHVLAERRRRIGPTAAFVTSM